jgi:tRNA (guanine26-N2/guanine27-N2)-dimethyltransferase
VKTSVIEEGKARISVPVAAAVTRKLPVFYNPAMAVNRDVSVLLLQALGKKGLRIADPLAGSGIRAIRFLKELQGSTIKEIVVNDIKPSFRKEFAKNLKLSKAPKSKTVIETRDANALLHSNGFFDYIDIDPFGSPAPFMDAAASHLSRDAILALTATDTAALAGTAVPACKRKYWAAPMHNFLMHEMGMRILARKAQLVAAQYDRALVPIYCHATLHYSRIYLQVKKGRAAVKDVLARHEFVFYDKTTEAIRTSKQNVAKKTEVCAGPVWTGQLWDAKLAKKISSLPQRAETAKLTKLLADEASIGTLGFYDVHKITSKTKCDVPAFEKVIKKLAKASRTHFLPSGIRTTASPAAFKKAVQQASKN